MVADIIRACWTGRPLDRKWMSTILILFTDRGKQHAIADALSRYPVTVNAVSANEQWLNPVFKNDFKKQQNKDSLTITLMKWVTKETRPKAEQIEGAYRELRYYWARFDELTIEDAILEILNPIKDGPDQRFCAIVPQQSKKNILEFAHGSSAGKHFGVL